ncbi:MAG: hypothetical protein KJZ78_07880 [Bryobacteraceae bacterium]|nr:hypothetical protein [Bryobacteraceae bacterium]
MADAPWEVKSGHPSAGVLLLYLEGELEDHLAAAVEHHTRACWTCRAQCERMERGIRSFVDFHETAEIPPPPAGRQAFLSRLREQAPVATSGAAGCWFHWRRGLVAAGGLSAAAMLALLVVSVLFPTHSVSAAQFLDRASRAAQATHAPGSKQRIVERIRIRRGTQVLHSTVHYGVGVRRTISAPPPAEMQRALELARNDWRDPLNVSDFAAWRESLRSRKDHINQKGGELVLTTEAKDASPVSRASLTVDQFTWRPVARHVDFSDQPPVGVVIESREVQDDAEPAAAAPPAGPPPQPPEQASTSANNESTAPDARQLERTELELRELFHLLAADVREAPEIWQGDGCVYFRLFAESPERHEEILRATQRISLACEFPTGPGGTYIPPEEAADPGTSPTRTPTNPPFESALREHFGGQDQANRYLDQVTDLYVRLLAEVTALERLGERYPDLEIRRMPPDEQARIERLARDHVVAIAASSREYSTLASSILDSIATRDATPPSARSAKLTRPCVPWQAAAPLIAANLRRFQRSFSRLFVKDEIPAPDEQSVASLLSDVAVAHELWQRHIEVLCASSR